MPLLPEPRHQVRQPASFNQYKSSCLPETYTRIKTDPLDLFASNLTFGSNVTFLMNSSYPCILKYNSLAFGTGNMHALRNKVLQCSHIAIKRNCFSWSNLKILANLSYCHHSFSFRGVGPVNTRPYANNLLMQNLVHTDLFFLIHTAIITILCPPVISCFLLTHTRPITPFSL